MRKRTRTSEVKTAPQSKAGREPRAKTQGLRLLVVEDHGDLRTTLETFLGLLGHRACFVNDMAAALHAAGQESFDVLLSDIGLPDGSGWDLLRRLEDAGRRPPHAIAMSGYGMGDDLAKSKGAGFALHLTKPFAPEDLEKALAMAGRPAS